MAVDLTGTGVPDRLFATWRRTHDDGMTMRVGRIRRRCKRLVKELALPATVDLRGLCDLVGARVGAPVHLVPMSLDGAASGMTAATDDAYWVFYESRTSPWHQAHIVLHELGHLLLGHDRDPALTEDALRLWTPSVDAATALRRMGLTPGLARHHGYDNPAERETEVLGTLLMERLAPPTQDPPPPPDGRAAELAAALGPALQHLRSPDTSAPDAADSGAEASGPAGGTGAEPARDDGGEPRA
ncbi:MULTISPECIES: hypothetical protein [Streptomyces]|uniref:IrrE N-terminal-like domain-containing protein n=1 Tax=Streptomyces ramulosus TaxID=47762 RepID=A0ABW1FGJ3_9ACTN